MPNHHFDKQAHMRHTAIAGRFYLAQSEIGGKRADLIAHQQFNDTEDAAAMTEHRYLCGMCGKTYVPKLELGQTDDLRIWIISAMLPQGQMLSPDQDQHGRPMQIVLAVGSCCKEIRDKLAQALVFDWSTVDHLGNPLPKTE